MKDFSWLPPTITLSAHNGDTIFYLDEIYKVFVNTIVNARGVYLFGKYFGVSSQLEKDGKHERFWHAITDPHNPQISDIKYQRAERLPWIRPMVDNWTRSEVLIYERVKKGEKRIHLFIPEHNYIVILTERKKAYFFVTAYYIDYSYKVKEYEAEYRKFGPKTKTAP